MNPRTLSAAQVVFGNAGADLSPHKQGGYQILAHTHGELTPQDLDEIEPRLFYYPSEITPIKRVFFTLESNKVVLGQITPLEEVDEFGRKGRYIAHCLVFGLKEFIEAGINPFDIFRSFRFFTSIEDALAACQAGTDNIPSTRVLLPEKSSPDYSQLAQNLPLEYLRLFWLATVRTVYASPPPMEIVGDPDSVNRLLELALSCLPTDLLWRASFDSYFYRGNPLATPYKIIGLPTPSGRPTVVVHASKCKIETPTNISPESAYELALNALAEGSSIALFLQYKASIFHFCDWLEGNSKTPPDISSLPDRLATEIKKAILSRLTERLTQSLNTLLPTPISTHLAEFAATYLSLQEIVGLIAGPPNTEQITSLLWRSYSIHSFQPPEKQHLHHLSKLMNRYPDPHLVFLFLCWTQQTKKLPELLSKVDPEIYQELIKVALKFRLSPPTYLIVKSRGHIFVKIWLEHGTHSEAALIAGHLLEQGEIDALRILATHTRNLPQDIANQLEKLSNQASGPVTKRAAKPFSVKEIFKFLKRHLFK